MGFKDMAGRGGARPGAGRKPGIKSEKTKQREALAAEAIAAGMTPLEIMLKAMRMLAEGGDAASMVAASQIAKDAAPYIHPRLSSVASDVKMAGQIVYQVMTSVPNDSQPATEPSDH